ncbi:MAG TPA: FMN-binding negative transcriptional regulator [Hypericibacter adhaerens]|jgi:transcriptional regulator|uniref:Transcriptional regulator n=1 Tax=Hypericibacter adhaerens TaxID=2602016 RepID=A0A5J6N390_9PROT|nr:FMN-binding negative transcriptional regulator [Hypericibacter adhaerens]QEX23927.1 transcriptional regulator [Hypericibacter adhaerens]HWA44545.1 FMN-binding negative transcriptional regulator [Hypericibacter adhaerens]
MYNPPLFREDDPAVLHALIRAARLCNFVTATPDGPVASPLPMLLDEKEGERGVLYGHLARANPHWKLPPLGEALAIFMGPDAYITPSWYASKQEHGKVVPTWNYAAVHAYGTVEFFEDENRLLDLVTRLTALHEKPRAEPWAVTDAPEAFIRQQLRAIVGIRMPIGRLEGKLKMSQNRSAADRAGVVQGLAASDRATDRAVAGLIPLETDSAT